MAEQVCQRIPKKTGRKDIYTKKPQRRLNPLIYMRKYELKIKVEVSGIEVEETTHYKNGKGSGWFKFDYTLTINGKKKKATYESSWSGQTQTRFRGVLRDGWAATLVVQNNF